MNFQFMSTYKSQEEIVNQISIISDKINFFTQNQQSLQALDSQIEQRPSITDNYNNSLQTIRDQHIDIQNLNMPNQSELDYYEEYRKVYLISYHLFLQKYKLLDVRVEMEKKIRFVEEKLRDLEKQEVPKKDSSEEMRAKRSRRTAQEIQRRYRCQVEFCQRSYGSEGSLQQHIKLKHPQLYKKINFAVYSSFNE